MDGTAAVIICC